MARKLTCMLLKAVCTLLNSLVLDAGISCLKFPSAKACMAFSMALLVLSVLPFNHIKPMLAAASDKATLV